MEPLLSFKGVTKGFDDVTILNKMDLEIESGHFYTLLGPSGWENNDIEAHSWI